MTISRSFLYATTHIHLRARTLVLSIENLDTHDIAAHPSERQTTPLRYTFGTLWPIILQLHKPWFRRPVNVIS